MILLRIAAPLWLVLCFFLSCSHVAASSLALLDVPAKVARGDAFTALAVSRLPVKKFVFHWLGKSMEIQAREAEGQWQGFVFLPVPLDCKKDKALLAVTCAEGGTEKQLARREQSIRFFTKKRPVQKLTVDRKYVSPPPEQAKRIRADRKKVRAALAVSLPVRYWSLPLTRPVTGSISSSFGLRRVFNGQPRGLHRGLDLRAQQGTPIRACADGQVALADNLYFSGNAVYLNHGEGVFTAYLHMVEILVQEGEMVHQGQIIGRVGATGRVTGPHLHLSLLVQGVSVDPQPFLVSQPGVGKKP